MPFSDLKQNSELMKELQKDIDKEERRYNVDERFWEPTMDEKGSSFAIIRFLPPSEGETKSFVKIFRHYFKSGSRWFIENCPTTIGKDCYGCTQNSMLWDTNIESNQNIVRKRKRLISYISNIIVLQDKANKQNEGKVFLYRYGSQIFEKIVNALKPKFEDEEAFNPFNLWSGANFKLKVITEGYKNYEKSEFMKPSALFDGNEDVLKKLWEQEYPLQPFYDEKLYLPYQDFKNKWDTIVNYANVEPNESPFESPIETSSFKDKLMRSSKDKKPSDISTEEYDNDLKLYAELLEE